MSIRFFLIFFLLSGASPVFAQLTVAGFLRSASTDNQLKNTEERLRYINEKPYKLSPLQRLEFRTQNRELQRTQQEYAIRVTPSNPWEVKYNNEYFKAFTKSLQLEQEMDLKKALADRYYAVIDFIYQRDMRALLQRNERLIQDQLHILEQQSGSSYFDADDYMKLQIEQLDATVDVEQVEVDLVEVMNEMNMLYGSVIAGTFSWSSEDVVSVKQIQEIIANAASASLASLSVQYQQQKVALASSDYKLEKSNINVGFLQTEFDHRRVEQKRTPFNISLGVTIPIVNPNKGDMTKRKLQLIDSQYKLDRTVNQQRNENLIGEDRLNRLVQRFENLQERMQKIQDQDQRNTLGNLKNGDPKFVLRYEQNVLKLQIMLIRIERELRQAYIEYLASSDKLQAQPLVNYLSGNLEQL
jgi:hypothetical protein